MKHLPILLILLTLLLIPFCPVLAVTPTHKSNYPSGAIFGYDTASSTYRAPAVSTDGKLSVDATVTIGSVSANVSQVGPTGFATDTVHVTMENTASISVSTSQVGPTSFATDPAYISVVNPSSFPAHIGPTGFSTDTLNITDITDYAPVLLTATESIISVNPNTVTTLTFANNIHGIWVNSFGGVALVERSTNLATGSIYRGVPIASGSGVKWEWNKPTTTPNIGLIMNDGVTGTCTISAW